MPVLADRILRPAIGGFVLVSAESRVNMFCRDNPRCSSDPSCIAATLAALSTVIRPFEHSHRLYFDSRKLKIIFLRTGV
jgi:hypothetical protein